LPARETGLEQSGDAGAINSAIRVDNLTVKATPHSTDLNLTLATQFADGSAIANGGVHNVTLSDYAAGQGASVDVTGNGLDNVIVGNSGINVLIGGGGNDTLDGGAGIDTAVYAGTLAQSALTRISGHWEVNGGAEGTDTLFNTEIVRHGGGRYLLVGDGGFAD